MKPWYLGRLVFLALGSSAQVAEGQRLSEGFRTHDVGSLLTQGSAGEPEDGPLSISAGGLWRKYGMACGRGSVRRCSQWLAHVRTSRRYLACGRGRQTGYGASRDPNSWRCRDWSSLGGLFTQTLLNWRGAYKHIEAEERAGYGKKVFFSGRRLSAGSL